MTKHCRNNHPRCTNPDCRGTRITQQDRLAADAELRSHGRKPVGRQEDAETITPPRRRWIW